MSKRFTETGKWDDSWFVDLPAEFKLAWLYCCDCCDHAGVIDLSPRLANFRIGLDVDWGKFVEASGERIKTLPDGKLWLIGFVEFQYGALSEKCKPHVAVIKTIKKHKLQRVHKGYPKGMDTLEEKEKDKDKEKEKDKDKEKDIPPRIEDVAAYCQERGGKVDAHAWFDFYQSKNWMIGKNKMKDWQAAVRTWERGDSRNGTRQSGFLTTAQQREANMKALGEKLQREEEQQGQLRLGVQ